MKLLFVSTPVGPLGSGIGGGVELTLLNTAQTMIERGHQVEVVAPQGSKLANVPVIEVTGVVQMPAQTQTRTTPILMPANAALARMWDYVRSVQAKFDLIVNFAYDWLPFYLTPFLSTPVAHWVSMGSLTDAMDEIIGQVASRYPNTIGVYTHTQAETFPFSDQCYPVGSGLDLSLYEFCDTPDRALCWLGRISPEKALEDAVAAAQQTDIPLKILGCIQDQAYFAQIQREFPTAPTEYLGFLSTVDMQQILRRCQALVVTPRWVEAFGNILIEALACGVPIIAYRRGGPGEIVCDGETGWLVEPDSIDGLVEAIGKIDQLDRYACRQQAESEYSLQALGDRYDAWFRDILSASKDRHQSLT